jgi:hypothetical protein
MPRGVRRHWFAIEASIIDHPKWMVLSWEDRGKWLAVRALAERQPSGEFKDWTHLATLLTKEGDPIAGETVGRLVAAKLLDLRDDGSIVIHDMDSWNPSLSTERVRRHRERTETDRNGLETAKRLPTYLPTYAAPPAPEGARAPARERTEGETLKAYLERIGAPVPEIAKQETKDGANGSEGPSDDDGKSRSRARRRRATTG